MRTVIRAALKRRRRRIAVVCGAWHVPALTGRCRRRRPTRPLLRGLPKTKVAITWVPWTHGRLVRGAATAPASPRPAGTTTCSTAPDQPVVRWLTAVAGVLRDDGTCRSPPRTSSRRCGWPRRWPRCAAGRWPGWPRSPRRPGPCSATATTCACGSSPTSWSSVSASGHVARRDADGAAGGRPVATSARGSGSSPRRWREALDLDLRKPIDLRAQPRCCTGSGCSASSWGRPAESDDRGARAPSGSLAARLASPSSRSRWSRPRVWGTTVARRGHRQAADGHRERAASPSSPRWSSVPARRPARRAADRLLAALGPPGRPGRRRRRT